MGNGVRGRVRPKFLGNSFFRLRVLLLYDSGQKKETNSQGKNKTHTDNNNTKRERENPGSMAVAITSSATQKRERERRTDVVEEAKK